MKKIIVGFISLFSLLTHGQDFEIPAAEYPYYDIIEWKGQGALLMSKDPQQRTKQIGLTLIGDQNTSIWDQKFNPKGEKFYFISSENARYVYFMDNLEPENGKIYFSQLNSAGNIKSTNISINTAVKKLGDYDVTQLELINIVVTDLALVHHFRYKDNKSKSVVEIATFMTHNNFLVYATELGSVPNANLKDDKFGQWQYIGFTDDKIMFAARDFMNKQKGWSVKEFTSKGKFVSSSFINAPEGLINIENIGFGTTGRYYLGTKNSVETGLLTYINGKYYMIGAQKKDSGAELTLYELVSNEWKEINSMNLNYFIEKKNLKLGIYPMNEGIGYHLDHNGYNKTSIIAFSSQKTSVHNDFTDNSIYNPSSVFNKKEKEEFSVNLPNAVLIFDTKQLEVGGAVKFELKRK